MKFSKRCEVKCGLNGNEPYGMIRWLIFRERKNKEHWFIKTENG
jgi:hypothetical protein